MPKLLDFLNKEYGTSDQTGAVAVMTPQPLKQPSKLMMALESQYGAETAVAEPQQMFAPGTEPDMGYGSPVVQSGREAVNVDVRKIADSLGIPTPGEFGAYTEAVRSGELDKDKKFAQPGMELTETAARGKFVADRIRKSLGFLQKGTKTSRNMISQVTPLVGALSAQLDRLDLADGPVTQDSLEQQSEQFTGAGGIAVPLTTDITAEALKWYFLGKAFDGVSGGAEVLKELPQVQKAGKTIESIGGIQKVAETMPRTYQAGKNAVGAFVKGYVVGAGKGTIEGLNEDMTDADLLSEMNRQGLTFGTISMAFSAVSSVDQAVAIRRLRTQMMQRGLQQVRDLSKGLIRDPLGKGKIKSLQTFEDAMVKHVEDVVAAYEAELSGAVKGELFKNIRGKAPEAQKEITRFLKKGYDPSTPSFAGKTPLRPEKLRLDVLRGVPTTKAGEVVEAVRHPVKAVEKFGKAKVEGKVRPSVEGIKAKLPPQPTARVVAPPSVAKQAPVEPEGVNPAKPQEGVQEPTDYGITGKPNKMQQKNLDALAKFPDANVVEGTTRIRVTSNQGNVAQVPAAKVQGLLDRGWTLTPKPGDPVDISGVEGEETVAERSQKPEGAGKTFEVFHGGPSSVQEIDPAASDYSDLRGAYFTEDAEYAQTFADEHGHGEGVVRKYKVTLQNPANDAVVDTKETEAHELGYKEPHLWEWVTEELKAEGYDGAVLEQRETTEVIAFDKKSISEITQPPTAKPANEFDEVFVDLAVEEEGMVGAEDVKVLPPSQQKTVADLEKDAGKKADVNIVFPKKRKIKAKTRYVQIADEKKKIRDFGNGFGMVGKNLAHIAPDGTALMFSRDYTSEESQRIMFGLLDKGIDTNMPAEEFQKQLKELAGEESVRTLLQSLAYAETPLSEIFTTPRKFGGKDLDQMKAMVGNRLGAFANTYPEFKINPTFTVDKEGMLVFKDHFKIRFSPDHFGINSEKIKIGQTIRFDLDSFDIKTVLSKKQKKEVAMFTGPGKVLTKTKKFVKAEKLSEAERKRRNVRYGKLQKIGMSQSSFWNAVALISATESENGGANERNIKEAVAEGFKAGRSIKAISNVIQQAAKDQSISVVKVREIIASVKPKEAKPSKPKAKGGGSGSSVAAAGAQAGAGYGTIEPSEKSTFAKETSHKRVSQELPAKGRVDMLDELLKITAPAVRVGSREGARVLRKNLGKLSQETVVAHESLKKAHHAFTFMARPDIYDFIDRMEAGQEQLSPRLTAISAQFRKLLDQRRDAVQNLGKGHLQTFYENYFPHIWKDPKAAEKAIMQIFGKRRFEGSKSFLKKRTIMTVKEGRDVGLELVSENPVDLVLLKIFEMDRYLMAHGVIQDLKARSLIKFVYSRSMAPEGYTKVNDRAFTVYMPPEIIKKEAYDSLMVSQMIDIARALGIDAQRFVSIGGKRWGYAQYQKDRPSEAKKVRTKYAGPVSVLAHEIGHILGYRYDLYQTLRRARDGEHKEITRGKKKGEQRFVPAPEAVDHRRTIDKEWRALADARIKDTETTPGFKKYLRKAREKEAVMLEALLHAPDEFKRTAPTLLKLFKKFLNSNSELRPLLDLKPSLVLGVSDAKIKIPGFTVLGHYYAPDPVAKILNNYLSPGLWNNENVLIGGTYNLLRKAGNILNQAQLSLSGFHALNVTTDMIASTLGHGIRQLTTKGQRAQGFGNILSSPIAPLFRIWEGVRLRNAYKQQIDTIENEKMRNMVKAVVLAGGRDRMDPFYYNQQIKALKKTLGDILKGSPVQKIAGMGKLPFNTFGATLETLAKPLMEWYVPTGKLGLFTFLAQHELQRAEAGQITDEQLHERLVSSWDSVDNRMGQLVYDNLFWNKTAKDIAMLSVRSVGWNLGSWREYGGVPVDILGTRGRLERGDLLLSQKMAYTIGALVLYASLGAIIMKILTGGDPEEPKDYFFPKTGNKNPDGSDERLSLPTYAKDWFAYGTQPIKTVKHKIHPLWGLMADIVSNEDFFSVEVRHPADPISQQMLDVAKHIGKEFLPLSVRNYKKMQKTQPSGKNVWVSITGITSAPSYISRSAAQKLMYRYIIENIPDKTRTKESFRLATERKNIKNRLRKGDPVDRDAAIKELGKTSFNRVVSDAKKEPFAESFTRLSFTQALNVYAIATPEERRQARSVLVGKHGRAQKVSDEMKTLYGELIQNGVSPTKTTSTKDFLKRK